MDNRCGGVMDRSTYVLKPSWPEMTIRRQRYESACVMRYWFELDDERDKSIVRDRRAGMLYRTIASRLGLSIERVRALYARVTYRATELRRRDKARRIRELRYARTSFGAQRAAYLSTIAHDVVLFAAQLCWFNRVNVHATFQNKPYTLRNVGSNYVRVERETRPGWDDFTIQTRNA